MIHKQQHGNARIKKLFTAGLWLLMMNLGPLFIQSTSAVAAPVFGRLVGTLDHDRLGRSQLAKMDFITWRDNANELKIAAVLTLIFGDFTSPEYVSYHFDEVKYDLVTSQMTFEQPDQEVMLAAKWAADGSLSGQLRSNDAGVIGTLTLATDKPANPRMPLMEPLTGEYRGQCGSKDTFLQIDTYRSTGDTHRAGNPFASYEIRASIGEIDENLCPRLDPNDPVDRCTKSGFSQGSYDFFDASLTLNGFPRDIRCKVQGSRLACEGQCTVERISKDMENPPVLSPLVRNAQPFPNPVTPGNDFASLAGDYRGYVYHESTGLYQAMRINLATFQDPGGNGGSLRVSAAANLYFGPFDAPEHLIYRFNERPFPISAAQIVFSRPEGDVDAWIKVDSFKDGVISGTWYSMLYGRVGPFRAVKSGQVNLPQGALLVGDIGGFYKSNKLDLSLYTALGEVPTNSDNPFYPLRFGGYFYYQSGIMARLPIVGGSYDFYTGKISLLADEGKRLAVGWFDTTQKKFKLKWSSGKFGTLMPPHNPNLFDRSTP